MEPVVVSSLLIGIVGCDIEVFAPGYFLQHSGGELNW